MLIGVLTISDRCSQGLMTDTAGPAVVALAREHWPGAEISSALLPDDHAAIVSELTRLSSVGASLILTVGGTGFGPRDRTPEATRQVIDREAPGLAEAMRAESAKVNKYAWLSRAVAGLRDATLILNLPGSKRGALESFTVILPLIRHGIEVAAGGQTHP